MTDQYPKGHGALFINNEKKSPNQPDFRGNIEVSAEQIRKLIDMAKAGLEPKLQLAGWNKVGQKSGVPYISMETEAYMKSPQADDPQYPPQQTGFPQGNPAPQQTNTGQAPQFPMQGQPPAQPQQPAQPQSVSGDFPSMDDIPF